MDNQPGITGVRAYPTVKWAFLGLALVLFFADLSWSYTRSDLKQFQAKIIDYRHQINPRFKKKVRRHTGLIIVHTSELGLSATLRVVSKGKYLKRGRSTPGGHANYVIARNGNAYRVLDHRYRADHAGLSMWNGVTDISSVAVGIELVGYHSAPISKAQYRSVGMLIKILQQVYTLRDRAVLTHSQIAYGRPNPWFSKNHRGRKRCAKNFDRASSGLGPTWSYDPDVRAGRLKPDPLLASVFYPLSQPVPRAVARVKRSLDMNVISKENSAWSIAGGDYNSTDTAYILPGGRTLPGDRVGAVIGWSHLPAGTKVLLNQETKTIQVAAVHPIKTISGSMTAWSHAGQDYRKNSTIYFLPSGRILPGSRIKDWDDLPAGTRLVVGYKGPFTITPEKTAYKIAGQKYKQKTIIYYLPGPGLLSGDMINDFSDLPKGVRVYLPL
ncbi:MAG: N-acetylmuramoyl-L-alanine amidase [Desulfobacter sp.]|nr:N-acetylmuramoyl-L-alanine amidase [Desulfobacter sp.]WDP87683.1 MAG: N-acetylmuramoyl-L-alanine amidase [Desulfobacter sp.]